MSTVSEMLIKIGADSSGLKQELSKTQETVNKAFNTNPITEFTNALTETTSGINGTIGTMMRFATLAASGFGINAIIDSAVNAGEASYQLSNKLKISTAEAGNLSRILKLTGTDADTFSGAILRLDKSMASDGEQSDKIKATLSTFGVSVTDANGKLLPLSEQLKNLASGYKKASEAGLQQEYLMNTLGVRGMALTNTLLKYDEAAENASKVKTVGLDAEEMHRIAQAMQVVKMQASQLEVAAGATLAPVAEEMFPIILSGLTQTAKYLAENKAEIKDITKNALELLVTYKSIQAASKIGSAVSSFWGNAQAAALAKAKATPAVTVDASALTSAQEKSINRAVVASNAGYAKMEKAAIKAAQTANLSAEESAAYISEKCIEISNQAAIAAEKIRAEMTAGFQQSNMAAAESASKVTAANSDIIASTQEAALSQTRLAEALEATGIAATAAGNKAVTANAEIAESARVAAVAESELASTASAAGIEGTVAGEKTAIANMEVAESARAATVAEAELAETTTGAGTAAAIAGEKAVGANTAAAAATLENAAANTALTTATTAAGAEAVATGTKTVGAMATAASAVGNLRAAVFALMGGWIGVAAATGYAIYKLVQYESTKNNIPSYNQDAEVRKDPETGAYQKKQWVEKKPTDEDILASGYTGQQTTSGYEWVNLNEAESEEQVAYEKYMADQKNKKPWMDNGSYDDDTLAALKAEMERLKEEGKKTPAEKKEKAEKDTTTHYSLIDNLGDYSNQAQYAAETYGIDPNLYGALIQAESGGNPNAVSSAGAIGFSQLMPDTASGMGVNANDPNENLMGGAAYLSQMLQEFGGDVRLALAAYNAGPKAVKDAGGVPNNGETSEYVSKVMGIYQSATTSTGEAKYDPASALKKLQQAKEEAVNLYASMASEINSETDTTYQSGMEKIVADVAKKSEQIAKLQAEGVDTTRLKSELSQYEGVLKSKVEDKWKQAWTNIKDETKSIQAQLYDDFAAEADAEYEATVHKLDEERKEKLKAIQQDKNDYAGKLAVDKWYNASVAAAAKKRDQEMQEAHEKAMSAYEKSGDVGGAMTEMNSQAGVSAEELAGKQKLIAEFYDLWKKANASAFEEMAQAASTFDSGLETIFTDLGSDISKASDLVENIGNLIISTIIKIQAQRLAANLTSDLLSAFTGGSSNSGINTSYGSDITLSSLTGNNYSLGGSNYDFSYTPFAEGGIVTAPTLGLIGERSYKEAIVPLTDGNLKSMSGGGGGVQVNITNNSSSKVAVENTKYDDGAQQWVLGVVVDAAERNVNGFGTNMKTALGAG